MNVESYESYSGWKRWAENEFGRTTASEALYFSTELARWGYSSIGQCRVVELGFGNGCFAAWARSRDANYAGTELIPELLERALEQDYEVYDGAKSLRSVFATDSVDLVVAFDVLEHVQKAELISLLQSVRSCLAPGGVLLVRMPSGDSPFSGAIRYGDITHAVTLGSSAVTQLAERLDFEMIGVREPAFPKRGLGRLTLLRRLAVAIVRRLVYPIIARGFMGGASVVLTPNMVFGLRKPKDGASQIES